VKRKDLIKRLAKAGYTKEREGSRHTIYSNGSSSVQVPRHTEVNENTAKEILKTAGAK
jgi:predicted RNA binding protein YcfA (HicA-like mRNA interferase family)